MTRPYRDRDPEQQERVRANQRRYSKTFGAAMRSRARKRALHALRRDHPAEYRAHVDRIYDELMTEWEREQGLVT